MMSSGGADISSEQAVVVENLNIASPTVGLVHEVSFSIAKGERVGLIGESGSGKSLTASALMGLLPSSLDATGSIRLDGVSHDIIGASPKQMNHLRGNAVSMVFQEPMTALNPTMQVGDQVAEVMLNHDTVGSRSEARKRVIEMLGRVQLPDPAAVAKSYPHQLSGGQRQRVVLAIALANDPGLLLCDEPTTALDVTVQAQMLDLITAGAREHESALLFITHDLAVVATVCERVLVLYGGRIVESGPVREIFTNPEHPYTKGLIAASDLAAVDARGRLKTIPGSVPGAGQFPEGCVFRNRCTHATEQCIKQPPWTGLANDGYACWHPQAES